MRAVRYAPPLIAALLAAGAVSAQQAPDSDVTTVSPVIVNGSGVAIPKVGDGAPLLTTDELHQMGYEARSLRSDFENGEDMNGTDCPGPGEKPPPGQWKDIYHDGADAARRLSSWSRLAEDATAAEQQMRLDALDGKATTAQLEAAELERQKDVNATVKAQKEVDEFKAEIVDIEEMVDEGLDVAFWYNQVQTNAAERASRKYASVPKEFEDLALENIKAVERTDPKGQPYLYVTGSIRNTHTKKIPIPPLQLTAVDQFGYPLLVQAGEAKGKIDPGKSQAFTYSLKPSPPHTARVVVTFTGVQRPRSMDPPECLPGNFPDTSGGDHFSLPNGRTFQNQN